MDIKVSRQRGNTINELDDSNSTGYEVQTGDILKLEIYPKSIGLELNKVKLGDIDINGSNAVQMLCYFGSSTLDTKEFSVLLEGVVSEMKEMGLTPPPSKEMRRCLEQWQKK